MMDTDQSDAGLFRHSCKHEHLKTFERKSILVMSYTLINSFLLSWKIQDFFHCRTVGVAP